MIALLLAACDLVPSVVVLDPDGEPVSGAEVYVNGALACTTDTFGCLLDPFAPGDLVYARDLVYEHPSYRLDHGPGAGWTARFYQTSRAVLTDGTFSEAVVNDPEEPVVLDLMAEQPFIGLNLVVSLSWDATADQLATLSTRMRDASGYLYNATDGQFLIEEVTLADDGQLWGSADIQFDVDNTRRPSAYWAGSLLTPGGGTVQGRIMMAPMLDDNFWSDRPATIVHELGHLAFSLMDEYDGYGVNGDYCTLARMTSTDPAFASNGTKAACFMDLQVYGGKMCTRGHENAHRGGLWQADPCWPETAGMFADTVSPTGVPRWIVTTPDDLGAVVDRLRLPASRAPAPPTTPITEVGQEVLDEALKPRITIQNNTPADVCEAFQFTDPAGPGSAGAPVYVLPAGGGQYTLGKMPANGMIWAHGVHAGDRIFTSLSDTVITGADCVLTQ